MKIFNFENNHVINILLIIHYLSRITYQYVKSKFARNKTCHRTNNALHSITNIAGDKNKLFKIENQFDFWGIKKTCTFEND